LEQSDTARAVNWEIHAKEEMIFLDSPGDAQFWFI
jgi:hypothetical protein